MRCARTPLLIPLYCSLEFAECGGVQDDFSHSPAHLLRVGNTARKLDATILEAAMTLGTCGLRLLTKVVLPGILPDLYRDQRILLGWAWTYLIVAELIGTSTGITWFITQQARYQHFDSVYAAIMMIGIIGFAVDLLLARLGRRLFPWDPALNRS